MGLEKPCCGVFIWESKKGKLWPGAVCMAALRPLGGAVKQPVVYKGHCRLQWAKHYVAQLMSIHPGLEG